MATLSTVNIFLGSEESLEELRKSLENILDIRFEPSSINHPYLNSEYVLYVSSGPQERHWCAIVSPPARYENDSDKNFEDFNNYYLATWAAGDNNTERIEIARHYARQLFDKLKKTNRYNLMMVEGVQRKLDQFDPKIGGNT